MWGRWLLVGLVLACTGCELRLDVEAAFDRNGGGRLQVGMRADAELLDRARRAGADPLGDLAAAGEALRRDGWRMGDEPTDDGGRLVTLTAGFDDAESFGALTSELAGALAAPELALLSPLQLTVDHDRLVLEGTAGLQPTAAVGELGLTPEQATDLLRDGGEFAYTVRAVLPGEVIETTAARRDGHELVWHVAPGEQVAILAVGQRPAAPRWPLAVGALLGLLITAVVLRRALVRRRRRDQLRPTPPRARP